MAHFKRIFRVNRSTGDLYSKSEILDAEKDPKMNDFVPNSYRNFLTRLPTPKTDTRSQYLDSIVQVGNAFLPKNEHKSDR